MNAWIPFLTALIWPLFVSILLILYRVDASKMIYSLRRRLERGDKFSVGGLAIESFSTATTAGIQSVATSEMAGGQAEHISLVTTAHKRGKVLIAASPTFRGDPSGLIGAGDLLGVAVLQAAFLRSAGVQVEVAIIRPPYELLEQLVKDNFVFVSLGGPSGNELTRLVMAELSPTLAFDGLTIFDRKRSKSYTPTLDNSTVSGKDWGLVLSLPHPTHGPAGRAVIVAGCYGYGTQAAAIVLAAVQEYPQLWEFAERGGCFEGLVEVTIVRGQIKSISVVEAREFGVSATKAARL